MNFIFAEKIEGEKIKTHRKKRPNELTVIKKKLLLLLFFSKGPKNLTCYKLEDYR